ncbi:hypothetical protein MUP95_00875, partial [bacterium]|nr:hypothetical protein [bacterium]
MTEIDEVLSFSKDYINKRSCRTPERKAKIRQVIRSITGQRLGKSCGTCYIEALFKILKIYTMAQYELKRGYVAQFDGDFKDVKAFTNDNLITDPDKYDPICEEWAKRYPQKAVIFLVRRPGVVIPGVPPSITIIPPRATIIIPPKVPDKTVDPVTIAE